MSRWSFAVVLVVFGAGCRAPHLDREPGSSLGGTPGPDGRAALMAPSFQPAIGLEAMDRRDDRARPGARPWGEPLPFRSRPRSGPGSVADLAPWVEPAEEPVPEPPPPEAPPEPHPSFAWPEEEKVRVGKDAPERFLDRYLERMVGDDLRRVQRTVGYRPHSGHESLVAFPDRNQPDIVRDREVTERRLDEHGHSLFVRPAEKSLRELDLYRDAKLSLEAFKSEYVGSKERGHFTGRLRRGPVDDTIEVAWVRKGLRCGTTGDALRVTYDYEVLEDLRLDLGSRYRYGEDDHFVMAGAHYDLSRQTSVHVLGGNNFYSNLIPTLFGLTNPFEQSSWGMGFYVEIRF